MTRRLGLASTGPKASMLTLMLLVSVATSIFVYSEPITTLSYGEGYPVQSFVGDDHHELATELLSLLEASHTQVRTALEQLTEEGMAIPEGVEDALRYGVRAAEEAFYYMDLGDYKSVIDKATEALQLFGEAIQIAMEAEQSPTWDEGDGDTWIVELHVRIERGFYFLSELNRTTYQLEENGLNVSDVLVLLEEACEHLQLASTLMEEGGLEAVESELVMAEACLEEVLKLLQAINEEARLEKALKFAETSEKRLDNLEDVVTNIVGEEAYVGLNKTVVQETLRNAKNVNKAVKTMIESGEIESATGDLEKVTGYAGDIVEMIEDVDEDLGKRLRKVERLEARKSNLEEKIQHLRSKGYDTTRLKEQLKGVNEELDSEIEYIVFSMSTSTEESEVEDEDEAPPETSEDPKSEDPAQTSEDPKSEDPAQMSEDPKSEDPAPTSENPPSKA